MNKDFDFIIEWGIWANLDSKKDLELILLKGHLILENVLGITLKKNDTSKIEMLSFYKRIIEFEKINYTESIKKKQISISLRTVNKLRNRLAHEYKFKINNGELESWSKFILSEFQGEKYTKFTHRTRIVHAFSTLAINIIELQ